MADVSIGRTTVRSPAGPAFLFLYGLLFANAITTYAGIQEAPAITSSIYGAAVLWMIGAAALKRPFPLALCSIDLLFVWFLAVLVLSVVMQIMDGADQKYYWRYLPLVVLPYVCGRLMQLPDVRRLFLFLVYAGIAFLPILAVERWKNLVLYHNAARPIMFDGLVYLGIPTGLLLGSAALLFSLRLLYPLSEDRVIWRTIRWILLALLCVGLVYVTIRSIVLATIVMAAISMTIGRAVQPGRRVAIFTALAVFLSGSVLILPNQANFYGKLESALNGYSIESESVSPIIKSDVQKGETPAIESELVSSSSKSDARKSEIPANPILGMENCGAIFEDQDSIEIRKTFQREAIAMISESSLFGVGVGAFGDHSCFPAKGIPHNTILHVFAELGLVGGLPFLGVLIISLMVLFRAIKQSDDAVQPIVLGVLMLLGLHTLVDQLQGNYLFAIGFYTFVGVTAAMHSKNFYLER